MVFIPGGADGWIGHWEAASEVRAGEGWLGVCQVLSEQEWGQESGSL